MSVFLYCIPEEDEHPYCVKLCEYISGDAQEARYNDIMRYFSDQGFEIVSEYRGNNVINIPNTNIIVSVSMPFGEVDINIEEA